MENVIAMQEILLLSILFGLIALMYASVGFGGGSSYLAILALTSTPFLVMRSTSLMCNIVVVSGGTYLFWKHGHLDLKQSLPLVLASVPMAFVGGMLPMDQQIFFILLGLSLFAAAGAMWLQPATQYESKPHTASKLVSATALGGGAGLLAGLVGIGGGIFLSPLLHLFKWDTPKRIAALCSFFILVNSIFGLAGQITRGAAFDPRFALPLLIAVLIGGQVGSRLTLTRLNAIVIKRLTSLLILLVSLRLLRDHLL